MRNEGPLGSRTYRTAPAKAQSTTETTSCAAARRVDGSGNSYLPSKTGFVRIAVKSTSANGSATSSNPTGTASLDAGNAYTFGSGLLASVNPPRANKPSQNVTEYEKTMRDNSRAVTPQRE